MTNTPASTYAGLGSAFVILADEKLKAGGRLAFVLPATTLTGSRWAPIRKLLLNNYDIEWVVVSHDKRYRLSPAGITGEEPRRVLRIHPDRRNADRRDEEASECDRKPLRMELHGL